VIGTFLLVGAMLVLSVWLLRPRLTEERIETAVITTLTQESSESFLVTGSLSFVALAEQEVTRRWDLLPGTFSLDLGTTRASVRVPGRVAYGFDVRAIQADDIAFGEDGLVDVALPDLTILSVEPDLNAMQIETDVGLFQTYRGTGREAEQAALRRIPELMRAQAEEHLATTVQSQVNSAIALGRLLTPVLEAVGLGDPRFRFRLSSGATIVLSQTDLLEWDESSEAVLDLPR
jgi:hypothetical protein